MASETEGWVGWFNNLKCHDHHHSHSEATDRGTREVVSPFGGGVHVCAWGVGDCGHRSSMVFTSSTFISSLLTILIFLPRTSSLPLVHVVWVCNKGREGTKDVSPDIFQT